MRDMDIFQVHRSKFPEKVSNCLAVRLTPENVERVARLADMYVVRTKVPGGSMMNVGVEDIFLKADVGDWMVASSPYIYTRITHDVFLQHFEEEPVAERFVR